MNAIKRLKGILSIARDDLWVVVIYGSAIGLFSLVIPIAAQGLVTIVSFGTILQPIAMLALAVFILLSAAAVLRIFQAILAENIQQRIFARVALELASRLPKIKLSTLDNRRGTELVNRFF